MLWLDEKVRVDFLSEEYRWTLGSRLRVTFHRIVHLNISQSILTFTYNKL